MKAEFRIENLEEVELQIKKVLENKAVYPAVVIDCPYAMYVEFGTDPADEHAPSSTKILDSVCGDKVTSVRYKFRNWAERKYGVEKRKEIGDKVYRAVMKNGLAPSPYIRPALHEVERRIMNKELNVEDGEKVAQTLVDLMKENLQKHKNIDTSSLYQSIRIDPNGGAEGGNTLGDIPPEVMDSDFADLHGNESRARNRGKR